MKRIFSLILVVAMVMGLSVQGFAASAEPFDFNNDEFFSQMLSTNTDDKTFFGVLPTSTFTEEAKDYLRSFFAVFTGQEETTDKLAIIAARSDSRLGYLRFIRVDESVDFKTYLYNSCYCFSPIGTYQYFGIRYSSSLSLYDSYSFSSCSGSTSSYGVAYYKPNVTSFPFHFSVLWSNFGLLDSLPESYQTWATPIYNGALGFTDDDGLLESVTPDPDPEPEDPDNGADSDGDSENSGGADDGSDSTGGGSPEFPDSSTDNSDNTIELPKIDYDPALVPYDLDAWDSIPKALMPQLKKVVSIAFPIVFIGMALEAFVLVVRHMLFAWLHKGGNGGGGVSSDE